MDIRRLQRLNKDFCQKVADAEAEVKRLKFEAYTTNEVSEAFLAQACLSRVEVLTIENEDLKKEVYHCKAEINAMTK